MNAETIFAAAIEFSGERRAAYIDEACGGDEPLRQRVDALLAAQNALEGAMAPAETEAVSGHAASAMIAGRYKLLEVIGEGGMGSVWLAEQREPVRRKVAVKLIKPGMDTAQVLARFESERQALALMDHPHIAKIFDGGTTEAGRPFFVMEYVKGTPLTEYCDQAKQGLQERLRLFVSVCQAVQHAHQKGVIHRDLKPSNILVALVDGRPEPKVIDFGLAKAMHQSLTEKTLHTAMGMMVGTPLYISPEQAEPNNLDIDTRTDIYSLGVILYELLTGTTPLERQQLKAAAFQEVLRLIKEVEPPKPSTRLSHSDSLPSIAAQRGVDPQQLRKSLAGDLDWIAMKALDKDRNRRYETANGLARDIERFLNDEAVEASPPSAVYRLKKLVRRHRTALAVAATFAVVLLIAAGVSTWQAIRATNALEAEAQQRKLAQRHEREANQQRVKAEASAKREAAERARAEKARDRTQEAIDSMTSFAAGDSLATQKQLSEEQKAFLAQALPYYQELVSETASDEKSRRRIAVAAGRLGVIEGRLGRMEQAKAAFHVAREELRKLAEEFPTSNEYAEFWASANNDLGNVFSHLGMSEEALAAYGEAQIATTKLMQRFPNDSRFKHVLSDAKYNAAAIMHSMGELQRALDENQAAAELQRELMARFPEEIEYEISYARSNHNRANMLHELGKEEQALALHVETRDRWRHLVDNSPASFELHDGLIRSLRAVGVHYLGQKEFEEARQQFAEAAERLEKAMEQFPSVAEIRSELADVRNVLGYTNLGMKRWDDARSDLAIGRKMFQELAAEFPAVPEHRQQLARNHRHTALLLRELGNHAGAEGEYVEARKIQESLVAAIPKSPEYLLDLFLTLESLAELHSLAGQKTEARSAYESARGVAKALAAKSDPLAAHRKSLAHIDTTLALMHQDEQNFAEARRELQSAFALLQSIFEESPSNRDFQAIYGGAHCNLGQLDVAEGNVEASLPWFDKAIEILSEAREADPLHATAKEFLFNSHLSRADARQRLGRHAEASDDRAAIVELASPDQLAWANFQHGVALLHAGEMEKAEAALDRGLALREDTAKEAGPEAKEPAWLAALYLIDRANVYFETNANERAIEWYAKAQIAWKAFEQKWPGPDVSQQLRWLHQNRAEAHNRLKQYSEAVEDWNHTLDYCPPEDVNSCRMARCFSQLRAGQSSAALAQAEELAKVTDGNGLLYYKLACLFCLIGGEMAEKQQDYTDRAMQLLKQSLDKGFADAALMANDSDLNPLREREEFQQLLKSIPDLPPAASK